MGEALAVIGELALGDAGKRERLWRRDSLAGRRVNVRLRRGDFEALCRAARLLDTSHTALARTFIINGSRQVLAERARL